MSTLTFLHKFLSNNHNIPELSQTYHHVYFRNMEAQLIGANKLLLNCFDCSKDILGNKLPYSDFINDPIELKKILDNDQQVFDKNNIIVFSEKATLNQNHVSFLSIKSPLYNDNRKIIGLCGISLIMTQYHLTDFMDITTKISKLLRVDWTNENKINLFRGAQEQKPKLTQRELECLSLYMKGNSTKSIANMLNLSNRTIEFYIENIKEKLGVNKRSELLPLAFKLYPELID